MQHLVGVLTSTMEHAQSKNWSPHAGLSFKKSPQALSLSEIEEGRGLQAPVPGALANSPVSLSSSLPFVPIHLTFWVSSCHNASINLTINTSRV